MFQLFNRWYQRYIADSEKAVVWWLLAIVVVIFAIFDRILAPVFVSVVIAYLLQGGVVALERFKFPHFASVLTVYCLFIGVVILGLVGLLPLLSRQLTNLITEWPVTLGKGQTFLSYLTNHYPHIFSPTQINTWFSQFHTQLVTVGQAVLSFTISSIPNLVAIVIYFILVPILVYFFLMDRQDILRWFSRFLPHNHKLVNNVWEEIYCQLGNYVRGKFLEMLLVWGVCYLVFILMGLQYAMLLSVLVGISVFIPYIGAVIVTIPVLAVAFLQWGWSTSFAYLTVAYALIIALDANVLVPLLFSEVVKLHPVAIIVAVLVFGGWWGFWGIFFAIPLAAVVKAILHAMRT